MNYEKFTHNIKILTDFEKALSNLGNGQPVDFKIKDPNGEIKKVSKEEFARWMINEKNDDDKKQVEKPRESLVFGAKGDIDGIEIYEERKGPKGVFKESYYQARSEEEKSQIRERQEWNKKKREMEKENSLIVERELKKREFQETNDKQGEVKPTTNQSSPLASNSNHHNDSCFGTVVLLTGLLLGIGLIGYGISFAIKKKSRKSR